jgi:hypothetical protein
MGHPTFVAGSGSREGSAHPRSRFGGMEGATVICYFQTRSAEIQQCDRGGYAPTFSAHVRLGERGAPVLFLLGSSDEFRVRGIEQWYPTSREKRARCGPPEGTRDKTLRRG